MIPLEAIKHDVALFRSAATQLTPEILGSVIDHTVLSPSAMREDIRQLCAEANEIGSFVCVNGSRVLDVRELKESSHSSIRGIVAVTDFPFGAGTTDEKCHVVSSLLCIENADEVDTVLNVGKFLDGDHEYVLNDIFRVAEAVRLAETLTNQHSILKIIQENCCLPMDMVPIAAEITASVAEKTGVHMFAKTSTGFGVPKDDETPKGATLKDVWMMSQAIEPFQKQGVRIGIKAAGGVGDAETAVRIMLAGGCFDDDVVLQDNLSDIFRIGASAGKKIVDDFKMRYCS